MEDVLDVYQRPYDADYPVVCFDETRKELHGSPRPGLPVPSPNSPPDRIMNTRKAAAPVSVSGMNR